VGASCRGWCYVSDRAYGSLVSEDRAIARAATDFVVTTTEQQEVLMQIEIDGQPKPVLALTTKKAVALGDLHSMCDDLKTVRQYLAAVQRVAPEDLFARRGMTEAAVIAYGRCHMNGRSSTDSKTTRRRFPTRVLTQLSEEQAALHSRVMDMRNWEVGHRVGAGQRAIVLAYADALDGPPRGIVRILHQRSMEAADLDGLDELCQHLLQLLTALSHQEEAAVYDELIASFGGAEPPVNAD
jgi:hypothetical protein